MVATTTRTRKPAAPVQVRPLDVGAGLYSALSSDLHTWYLADVKDRTCTCPAGQRQFAHCKLGACRHLIAARVIARGLASMTPHARAAALRLTNYRVHVERVDLASLDAPLARTDSVRTPAQNPSLPVLPGKATNSVQPTSAAGQTRMTAQAA